MGDVVQKFNGAEVRYFGGKKRLCLAQNFLRRSHLAKSIISGAGLSRTDVVYEIGPGKGVITGELAKVSGRVIAIEKDTALAEYLLQRFQQVPNVVIKKGDFLHHKIEITDYKIISNLPFNITSRVLKRILFENTQPKEALLIVQKEVARKYAGVPHSTEVSILASPWFQIKITERFHRTDFEPVPSVDIVLLQIVKREKPLIAKQDAKAYKQFVALGFRSWKRNLRTAFKHVFTHEQWRKLAKHNQFPINAVPTQLTSQQWLVLFQYFLEGVDVSKKRLVLGNLRC